MSPLLRISELGQALWLDEVPRQILGSARLQNLISDSRISGLMSTFSALRQAMDWNSSYEGEIRGMMHHGLCPWEILESVRVKDARMAADAFGGLHESTGGLSGYVTLDADPRRSHDTEGTLEEGRRLWRRLARPNVYVAIPATQQGLCALKQMISEGINVNATFLTGVTRYREVANAFLEGLERRLQDGQAIDQVRSVASFSLSSIDSFMDPVLEDLCLAGGGMAGRAEALRGQVAISSAKVAYQVYQEIVQSDRWKRLANEGGHPQLLVWKDTQMEDAAKAEMNEVKYIDALIGPSTICVLSSDLLESYSEQGHPQLRLTEGREDAQRALSEIRALDIDVDRASLQLIDELLQRACTSFEQVLRTLEAGNVRGAIEVRRTAPLS